MTISNGPITQIAWVTTDLDATESFLSASFGVRKWTRIPGVEFGPESCSYRGEPADFVADISLSYLGDMQLELIRPVRGISIYTEFLERGGQGLHHVCFEPDDFDAAVAQAQAQDVPVLQRGSMAGGMRFAYLGGAQAGVPYTELAEVSADMRKFFDYIKKEAQ
jgi:catechol 2,3-dioxygenase-like lactoylglutathione lyase family enzyme